MALDDSFDSGFAVLRGCVETPFRVLQVTDFHNDAADALVDRTYTEICALVKRFRPDLLAVTGDIWCGDEQPERAPAVMRRDLAFLGALEVPWAFTWGNHDYVGDFEASMQAVAGTPHAVAPRGDGRGNFRIEVRTTHDDVAR
jgi:predicted MPP superfamily phosphohydrolase